MFVRAWVRALCTNALKGVATYCERYGLCLKVETLSIKLGWARRNALSHKQNYKQSMHSYQYCMQNNRHDWRGEQVVQQLEYAHQQCLISKVRVQTLLQYSNRSSLNDGVWPSGVTYVQK